MSNQHKLYKTLKHKLHTLSRGNGNVTYEDFTKQVEVAISNYPMSWKLKSLKRIAEQRMYDEGEH